MADDFDTGSGYKEKDELTSAEKQQYAEMMKLQGECCSEFTFWMREHGASPKKVQFRINCELTGKDAERFMWLYYHVFKVGWTSKEILLFDIVKAGVASVYQNEQNGVAAQMMQQRLVAQLGPEIAQPFMIQKFRDAMKKREEIAREKEAADLKAMEKDLKGESSDNAEPELPEVP